MTDQPLAPEPDDKNWTWVLERPCPDCGFDGATVDVHAIGDAIRANAAQWEAVLVRPDVRERPSPQVWSPLEYACHVRDVFRLFDTRLHLMIDTDGAHFANWDQDVTAIEQRYHEQDPATVAGELRAAAEQLAASYGDVTDWTRRGIRSDGSVFTIDSFTRYLIHDPLHHLWDVGR